MGFFKNVFTKRNKSIKPGKLTKKEKRMIFDMNPDMPLTDDTDILLTAKILPQTYLDREKDFRLKKETERRTQRFVKKSVTKRHDSDELGTDVRYLGDKRLSEFLDDVGIKITAKGARTRKYKRHKKRRTTRKRLNRK